MKKRNFYLQRNIDIVIDVKPRTVFMARSHGGELCIIAGWKNHDYASFIAAKGIKSLKDLKGKRIASRDPNSIREILLVPLFKREGLDPQKDIMWMPGLFGSARLAAQALREGKFDAAIVANQDVPQLLEEGFNKLFDYSDIYPNGRLDRVLAPRGEAIRDHPELVKAFLKGMIRAYHFCRTQPENYAFVRYVEAKLRVDNPDEGERNRDLLPQSQLEAFPSPLDGKPSVKGLQMMLEEEKEIGTVPEAFNLNSALRLELVNQAWDELKEYIKASLKRLEPLIKKYGH